MRRTVSDHRSMPHPKPVEKIELSEKNSKRRLFLTILFLIIGALALTHAFIQFLSKDAGWVEISANSASEVNCSEDFMFLYELGESDRDTTTENKALSILYTEATVKAYQMFNTDMAFTDFNNMYSINHNPNTVIEIDPDLYSALKLVQESGNRDIYMGPLYAAYDDMFFAQNDSEIVEYDPYQNPDVAAYYAEIAAFARNADMIDLELMNDNQVCLHVSDEYLSYAEENGISDYMDFFWMKNAFCIDYVADTLIAAGYSHGSISSYDGFVRNLDDREVSYSFGIYNRQDHDVYQSAILDYVGQKSIVYMRNYMMSDKDLAHYCELQNSEIRTSYIDIADGLCKSARNDLVCYSNKMGCSEIVLQMSPIFITDQWDADQLESLKERQIYAIYSDGKQVKYTESELKEIQKEDVLHLQ